MAYETDIIKLLEMSAAEWDAFLDEAHATATVPRKIIRVPETRIELVRMLLADGLKGTVIAKMAGVTVSMVSKIKHGVR